LIEQFIPRRFCRINQPEIGKLMDGIDYRCQSIKEEIKC
jgi:hypothetical protein